MTGFEIRKRGSVPVFNGIVICAENEEKVLEQYTADEERRRKTAEKKRIKAIHDNWHKLVRYPPVLRSVFVVSPPIR
jgi:xeroderma pigmentosum group C-complementing protein